MFGMNEENFAIRNVTPRLDFHHMSKEELQDLQEALKKAISTSKIYSGIVAAVPALIFGGLIFGIAAPTAGVVIGLILFFVIYAAKHHEYWTLFFSSSYHFYTPISIRHLYTSTTTYLAEYGLFGMYTAPFKKMKIAREFAKANDGRKMNEHRAIYELNLISNLLKNYN